MSAPGVLNVSRLALMSTALHIQWMAIVCALFMLETADMPVGRYPLGSSLGGLQAYAVTVQGWEAHIGAPWGRLLPPPSLRHQATYAPPSPEDLDLAGARVARRIVDLVDEQHAHPNPLGWARGEATDETLVRRGAFVYAYMGDWLVAIVAAQTL